MMLLCASVVLAPCYVTLQSPRWRTHRRHHRQSAKIVCIAWAPRMLLGLVETIIIIAHNALILWLDGESERHWKCEGVQRRRLLFIASTMLLCESVCVLARALCFKMSGLHDCNITFLCVFFMQHANQTTYAVALWYTIYISSWLTIIAVATLDCGVVRACFLCRRIF